MFGRVVAEKLTAEFGWNVVVENKPGAGGSIGVDAAVKAAPDGYTIVLGQTSNLAVNPTLYPNLTYDPLKDLKPVVLVAESPIVLAVGVDSKYKRDRKSVVEGKSVSVRVDLGGRRNIKKKKKEREKEK